MTYKCNANHISLKERGERREERGERREERAERREERGERREEERGILFDDYLHNLTRDLSRTV